MGSRRRSGALHGNIDISSMMKEIKVVNRCSPRIRFTFFAACFTLLIRIINTCGKGSITQKYRTLGPKASFKGSAFDSSGP
jgi:hypothetical protein